jgi:hypothetical protein
MKAQICVVHCKFWIWIPAIEGEFIWSCVHAFIYIRDFVCLAYQGKNIVFRFIL